MTAAERVELAGAPMLVGVAFALGGLLAAVLPTPYEYARRVDGPANAQSLAYLGVLTRASPSDDQLRRLYVRQLSALGQFDEALATLDAAGKAPADPEAANLRFDLLLVRARALPEASPARAAAFAAVLQELGALRSTPQTARRLRDLSAIALELEQPHLAAEYLLGVASLAAPGDRPPILGEAARWLSAASDAARAADCYRKAALLEPDAARARGYRSSAIDALQAQDDVGAAADLAASYADQFPRDADLVGRAADLAASADRPVRARDLGRRALALHPDDESRILAQVRRELAAADPPGALPLVHRLTAAHPSDAAWRTAEARIAEWAGNPDLALDDWLWLAGHGVEPPADLVLP